MKLTKMQWDALVAASWGTAETFHGKTKVTLFRRGLLHFVPGEGVRLTRAGLNWLYRKYPPGRIGAVR